MSNFSRSAVKQVFLFHLFLLLVVAVTGSAFGQKTLSGKWKARTTTNDIEKIHISFSQDSDGKGSHHMGTGFKMSDLQGLSKAQISGSNSAVNFKIVREAGTIDMTGRFDAGKGSGTFRFTSNSSFESKMKDLGFEEIPAKKLFASAVLNIKSATASELRSAGLKVMKFEDVFKATIFKIDAKYISDMNSAGFKNLDMEDLVKGRIFKIDAKYAKDVLAMGFGEKSLEELVKFRIFKVTPEFLSSMKAEGFSNLTAEQVVKLRIFKINSDFIRSARSKGYSNPSVEELVELKIHGKVK